MNDYDDAMTVVPESGSIVPTTGLRPRVDLEEFLLFSVLVANKPAVITRDKLQKLLAMAGGPQGPFDAIESLILLGRLGRALRQVRTGQYTRIRGAFKAIITRRLDPATCSLQDLEAIPGIGPKTARFFLLHTRPGLRLAALDTHILKFLTLRQVPGVPKSTPPAGRLYRRLEEAFLAAADEVGLSPAELDAAIWNRSTKQRFDETEDVVYASRAR